MKNASVVVALLVLLSVSPGASAQTAKEAGEVPARRQFEISRATSEILVDGVLDEPAWYAALLIDLPWELSPGDNVPAPVETHCLVTYDDDNLYVGFRAFDPEPAAIRAHLMDRDDVSFVQDDHVGFMIDTFNDERRAYQFRVNPLGVQIDAIFNELTRREEVRWDAIWKSVARITAEGYTVELAVPFHQIRFPRGARRQTWGIEAFRSYPRSHRHRISSKFTDRDKECILCQENKMTGFAGIRPGLNLELDPTVTALRTDELVVEPPDAFPAGTMEKGAEQTELGISARWGMTPDLTLNATLNPDFSQVEADAAQLAVNTRFALFYPEKRPFFLESADFFSTPLEAVFSRTIFDPNWGLKLTGKAGKNALGIVLAQDDVNNLLIPSNQASLFVPTRYEEVLNGVLRYRRDVGARSTLGVLFTGRRSGEYRNQVYGVDGFIRFTTSDRLSVQFLHSETEYPWEVADAYRQPMGDFGDDAFTVVYDHLSRNWIGQVSYQELGADFRADGGYVPRVDLRTAQASLTRAIWGDAEDWYTRLDFSVRGLRSENHRGQLTDDTGELSASWTGPLQSSLRLALSANREFYNGTLFDLNRGTVTFQIRPSGKLSLRLDARIGDAIDLAGTRRSDALTLNPVVEWKVGRHLNLQLDHLRETLDVAGGKLLEANLSQLRLVYQFNVRIFTRAIIQYLDVERNPELFSQPVDRNQKELFSQLLFSYKLNPQTVLFAGYTETRLGRHDVQLTQSNRTFFFKLGYAFLF